MNQSERVHAALERLKAMQWVYAKAGNRNDSNYRFHDRGAVHGLDLAIDEITAAMCHGGIRTATRMRSSR